MRNEHYSEAGDRQESLHPTEEIFHWLEERKRNLEVRLDKISLEECKPWYYDENSGMIRNTRGTFFQITGLRWLKDTGEIAEQPIIFAGGDRLFGDYLLQNQWCVALFNAGKD